MTDTKTRRAPQKREYGMVVDVRLFVPVNRADLDNQIAVSQAVRDVQTSGETKDLFAIPGARVHSLLRPARFEALRAADAPAEVEGQTDIEDVIEQAPEYEEPAGDTPPETEGDASETVNRGRGRRAAA